MTANAILGIIGALLGGAACFSLGYHCALKWVAAELDNIKGEFQEGSAAE